jgi:hypothetical protein
MQFLVSFGQHQKEGVPIPFVYTNRIEIIERLPGRSFYSASMAFAHYEFAARFVNSWVL